MAFHRQQSRDRAHRDLHAVGSAFGHRPRHGDQLVESHRQIGAIGPLHREVIDQRRIVLDDFRVTRHQEIDHDVDRFSTISRGNLANQLEAPKPLALGVSMALKRADQGCVLAVAERFRVQADVHVERADMRHVLVGQQQPRNRAADDGELALETAEYLTDLNQHGFDCRGRPVVVFGGRLWFLVCHLGHESLSWRKCSAASVPRSPAMDRSR